jgi:hypothetical protein
MFQSIQFVSSLSSREVTKSIQVEPPDDGISYLFNYFLCIRWFIKSFVIIRREKYLTGPPFCEKRYISRFVQGSFLVWHGGDLR